MSNLYPAIDTPAVVVDRPIMLKNMEWMMDKVKKAGIKLRPHTKTHRTPAIAKLQVQAGASGITVAKLGEAEVMVEAGFDDIFIANQVVGPIKLERLREVHRRVKIAVGVDNTEQVAAMSAVFKDEQNPLDLMIEVDVGEHRTGVATSAEALTIAKSIAKCPGLSLRGLFTHEGHSYGAPTAEQCQLIMKESQEQILAAAQLLRDHGFKIGEISIGSTPSLIHGEILPGITEVRPGTFILMDAAQGRVLGDYSRCAVSVLATVVSTNAPDRVVVDAGVKALTSFTRGAGICATPGFGLVKGFGDLRVQKLYDEHGMIISTDAYAKLKVGDQVEIIPNHVCPMINLYDKLYIVEKGSVVTELPILCRGKSQ